MGGGDAHTGGSDGWEGSLMSAIRGLLLIQYRPKSGTNCETQNGGDNRGGGVNHHYRHTARTRKGGIGSSGSTAFIHSEHVQGEGARQIASFS